MDIAEKLAQPLPKEHIKTRDQGGVALSYIEGWYVIDIANQIFGHLGWNRETLSAFEVCRYQNERSNHVVGYEARVRVTIHNQGGITTREGTGHGSGISKDLFSAIESAAKEAETDATKRALMTLGYPLGLALYDKEKRNVSEQDIEPTAAQQSSFLKWSNALESCLDSSRLETLIASDNYKNALQNLDGTPLKSRLIEISVSKTKNLESGNVRT